VALGTAPVRGAWFGAAIIFASPTIIKYELSEAKEEKTRGKQAISSKHE